MIPLPEALEPLREQLLTSRQTSLRMHAQKMQDTLPWQSKVGGIPYLPKDKHLPTSSTGQNLFFLAQINFTETPPLPPFPQSGLLQFFIADDNLLGMNVEFDEADQQNGFQVRWYEQVITDVKGLSAAMPPSNYEYLPHHPEESYPLTFELVEEIAPVADYRFYEIFGQSFFEQFGTAEWKVYEAYEKMHRSAGHKIGGYAYFTQDDPRSAADPLLLLFQLDSDEKMDLQWGDMGIGHFFIPADDLIARRFDRVRYSWDCL